jgi:hypothetical protein
MPIAGDDGTIMYCERQTFLTTSGAMDTTWPKRYPFLPPVPIAAPELHLYAMVATNIAALYGDTVHGRFGFTTAPAEVGMALEIHEVWGW